MGGVLPLSLCPKSLTRRWDWSRHPPDSAQLRLTPTGHLEPGFPGCPYSGRVLGQAQLHKDSEFPILWGPGSAGIWASALLPEIPDPDPINPIAE